jgi:tetrahydromethanopterin S-methyltransferase subunit G
MRKIVLSLGLAGAALFAASPAAAQYYPAPQPAPYGYGYGHGYGYGYGNYGQIRELQIRIDNIERQINRLDRRDRIGNRSADRLRDEADRIERRLHDRARGGLSPREAGDLQYRIQRLEQRVQFAFNDRNGRYGDRWDRDHDRD